MCSELLYNHVCMVVQYLQVSQVFLAVGRHNWGLYGVNTVRITEEMCGGDYMDSVGLRVVYTVVWLREAIWCGYRLQYIALITGVTRFNSHGCTKVHPHTHLHPTHTLTLLTYSNTSHTCTLTIIAAPTLCTKCTTPPQYKEWMKRAQ